MASLNTLRTKFGFVLSIIIALALLAFILSLKTEMGFSGNDPKVGVIDGNKINYSEYLKQYDQMKQQSGASEGDEQQNDMLYNATWQSLISRYVLTPGFSEMGIIVTEPERLAMVSGEQPSQVLYQAFADPRTGQYNVAAVTQFLTQAETNVQAQQAWGSLNEQARLEREMQKYLGLVKNGTYVNALEIAKGLTAANNTFSGKWAGKKYAQVSDSIIAVKSGEIKSYYNSHKGQYKQTPSRTLSYVVFEGTPTAEDMLALEATVRETGVEFAEAEDLKAFVRGNRNGQISDRYVGTAQLPAAGVATLMEGKTYGPVLENNVWTMSRTLDSKMAPDSLGIRHIVLPAAEEKLADSLFNVLKSGANFAQLAAQYSVYEATAANGGEVGVLPFSAFTGEFVEQLAGAKTNDIVKIASGDAIQLMQIYRADKPSKQLQIVTITYPVEASADTRRNIHNTAGTFTVNAKGEVGKFNDAAATAAVTPRIAVLPQSERSIRGLEDSREVARWAFGAKEGDLSEIFKVGKDYVVAMLTEIDDNEIAPLDKVAAQVRDAVIRDKKYDYIVSQISGATLDEQAASLGSEVAAFENVNNASFYISGLGVEPRLIGSIASTEEKGTVSVPVKGLQGVYVFSVDDVVTTDKQTTEGEKVRAQAMSENMAQQMVMSAIQQMAKVQDLRGKYF